MYVCICKAVTDKQLKHSVNQGKKTIQAVSRCSGLGSECGKCVGYARQRILHHIQESPAPTLSHPLNSAVG